MANVQKRGDAYRIRVSNGHDPVTGTRLYHTMTWKPEPGMTERQIEHELERQKVLFEEKCRRTMVLDDTVRLEVFVERWREEYAVPNLKKTTLALYDELLKRILAAMGHLKLCDITPFHLNAFYANLREDGIRVDYKYRCKVDFRQLLKDNDISRTKLSDYAGVSIATIESVVSGKNVNRTSAEKLCRTMELELDELFETVGTEKKLSPKTLLHYHRCLSAIFSRAVKWGVMFSNPCERVEPPKLRRKEAASLDEEQAKALLEAVEEKAPLQYHVIVKLMIFSGARRAEVCGLEWGDIDWQNDRIHIQRNSLYLPGTGLYEDTTKTESSDRIVKLPKAVMEILEKQRTDQQSKKELIGDAWQEHDKVFTQWNGKPINPSYVSAWLRKFCEKNGLPHTTPHMLRHTSATLLLMQGIPLKAVSSRLGHTLASTTSDIYGHSLRSVEDIAADKLEAMLEPVAQIREGQE